MRVFERSVYECLVIDHHLEIEVLEIHATHVRLGITTPGESPYYREETIYLEGAAADEEDAELAESMIP